MPTSSIPSRDAVFCPVNRGVCLSQLIHQLEELSVMRREKTPKALKNTVEKCPDLRQKLPPSIHKTFSPALNSKRDPRPGSTTCCGHLEATSLYDQQPGLKSNKPLGSWLHRSTRWHRSLPHSSQGDGSDMAKSEAALRITPVLVTRSTRPRDRGKENGQRTKGAISSSFCLGDAGFEGLRAGTSSGSSTGHSSSAFMDSPSDDSDLSDQEKANAVAREWATPMALNLRPEPFDRDPDSTKYLESVEDQRYPEVLPAPLKLLDLAHNLSNSVDDERRQSVHLQDPSLAAFVSRLAEMERLQAATVQKERSKFGRSRPATAITMTRSAIRLRRADFLASHPESLLTETELEVGCSSALSGFADLALSHNLTARRRLTTPCAPSKQSQSTKGSNVNPTLPRQPHLSSTKLSRTSSFLSGQSSREGLLLKATPSCKVSRHKGSKKVTSRSKRKLSCSARKLTAGPVRKV
ncbi:hypothetical protein MATL_G00256180 [Megalops atlanticus]|uniref:Uncharacterized protein n=1 Tax=Megalops atlanticus TaxID=7932 RepID=A0A9D3SWC9_MEGAT|nr:hypothetical protein MATL_G00256180 [Megalops atlanticus]